MTKINYSKYDIESECEEILDHRAEFDPVRTPSKLASEIQQEVDSVISSCPDCDWNEDLITYRLIESLRGILSGYRLPGVENEYSESKFDFEAYKLTGKAEQCHGDIAFIVTRKFPYRFEPVSGVAFYEAKASGSGMYSSDVFPSFSVQQLRRLVTHTPRLNYLIYNKEKKKINYGDWQILDIYRDDWRSRNVGGIYAHAITVDANFLKQYRDISEVQRLVGQSFGSHLVDKILSGRDLDCSRSVEEAIKRWLKYTRRSSPLIVSVSVFETPDDTFKTRLELPGIEKIKFPELKSG